VATCSTHRRGGVAQRHSLNQAGRRAHDRRSGPQGDPVVSPGYPTFERLTQREDEILQLLAKGFLSREIALQLSISLETVNSHLKHIYNKLHVRSRTEAVIKYLH